MLKTSKTIAEEIEEKLKELDFEPQLKIKKASVPFLNKRVLLADGKSSHPKNPTICLINEFGPEDEFFGRSAETIAVMYAAIVIRKRCRGKDKKPGLFLQIKDLKSDKNFWKVATELYMKTWDEWEFDAEIVARIAGYLFDNKHPITEIKEILTMDASAIIEKLGMNFIRQSMWI